MPILWLKDNSTPPLSHSRRTLRLMWSFGIWYLPIYKYNPTWFLFKWWGFLGRISCLSDIIYIYIYNLLMKTASIVLFPRFLHNNNKWGNSTRKLSPCSEILVVLQRYSAVTRWSADIDCREGYILTTAKFEFWPSFKLLWEWTFSDSWCDPSPLLIILTRQKHCRLKPRSCYRNVV